MFSKPGAFFSCTSVNYKKSYSIISFVVSKTLFTDLYVLKTVIKH